MRYETLYIMLLIFASGLSWRARCWIPRTILHGA